MDAANLREEVYSDSIKKKHSDIKEFCKRWRIKNYFDKIQGNVSSIKKIWNLFFKNIVDDNNLNGTECFYFYYYYGFKKDKENKKKYLLNGIGQYHANCIFFHATDYYRNEKYDLAIRYYILNIEHNQECKSSLANLCKIYSYKLGNYYEIKRLCLKWYKEQNKVSYLHHLALLYHYDIENYQLAKKYYLMVIDNDEYYIFAYTFIAKLYYSKLHDNENGYKYLMMAYQKSFKYVEDNKPFKKSLLNFLSPFYYYIGNYDLIEEYLLKGIKIYNSYKMMFSLARMYSCFKHDLNLAKKYYLLCLETNPKYVRCLLQLKLIYRVQNDKDMLKKCKWLSDYYSKFTSYMVV